MDFIDAKARYELVANLNRQRLQLILGELKPTPLTFLKMGLCRYIDPQIKAWDAELEWLGLQLPDSYFEQRAQRKLNAEASAPDESSDISINYE